MKSAVMLESTRRILQGFPKQVRIDLGTELRRVQEGLDPPDWRPMPTIGVGVREIRTSYRGQWRLIYVTTFDEAVYVLHAFQKKTRQTSRADIATAKRRLHAILKRRS